MKYIVMECHTSYAVLLDEEGRFVKAANLHYEQGQTVEDPVLMRDTVPSKKKKIRGIVSIAAAAACFFLVFNSYYQSYMLPDTAIYLRINPSVCMELNRKGNVVRLIGTNEDGEKLLENYKRSSNDRLVVTDELIDRAIAMGFLSEGGRVVIDIDAPDQVHFQKYGVELRTNLTEYLESQLTVDIEIIEHGLEILEDTVPAVDETEPVSNEPESEGASEPQEKPASAPAQSSEEPKEPVASNPPEEPKETAPSQPSEEPKEAAPSQPAEKPKETAPVLPAAEPKEAAPSQPAQKVVPESDSGYSDYEESGYTDYNSSDYNSSDYDSSGYSEYEESEYSGYSDYDSSDYE